MNKAFLMGRLTKDPDLRMTATGIPVTTFTLAVDRGYARQGEERKADFFNIVVWRATAEFCKKYLTKGSQVLVSGSIQNRSWDGTDGQKHYITEIVADTVEFAGSRRSDTPGQGAQPAASSDAASAPDSGSGFYPIEDDADIPF